MSDFKSKVVLITGSARGIGKGLAERFGKLGASVVVNSSASEKPAQETVAEIERLGADAIAVPADVAKVRPASAAERRRTGVIAIPCPCRSRTMSTSPASGEDDDTP